MDNSVKSLTFKALEYDSRGEKKAAHFAYKEALFKILGSFTEPQISLHDQTSKEELFKLARNCLDRLEDTCPNDEKEQKGLDDDDNNQDAISDDNDNRDYLCFVSSEQNSRRESRISFDSAHIRTGSVSSDKQPSQFPPQQPQTWQSTSSTTSRLASPTKMPISTPANITLNLSALRRAHESELVAKQKEKSQRILKAHSNALDQNEKFLSDVLRRRQTLLSTVNEKLNEVYGIISVKAAMIKNNIDMEIKRKSIRNSVLGINQKGVDFAIIEPIIEMLDLPTNPLAALVRDFVDRCRQQLSLASKGATLQDHTLIIDRVFDEINIIEYQLVELICRNFDELKSFEMKVSVKVSIQNYFFTTALGPALFTQVRKSCSQQDNELVNKFIDCSWQDLFKRLKVRSKLQLPRDHPLDTFPIRDSGIYSRAVEDLRAVSIQFTPVEKLLCMTRCCNTICQAVDEYTRESPIISEDNIKSPLEQQLHQLQQQQQQQPSQSYSESSSYALGSEDLLLLCAYVIIRAQIPDFSSQLLFISKLVPEELLRGEAGYVLATMQTALDYALAQL